MEPHHTSDCVRWQHRAFTSHHPIAFVRFSSLFFCLGANHTSNCSRLQHRASTSHHPFVFCTVKPNAMSNCMWLPHVGAYVLYFCFLCQNMHRTASDHHNSLPLIISSFFLPRRGQLERRSHILSCPALCYLLVPNRTWLFCFRANRNVELHVVTTSYLLPIIVSLFSLAPKNLWAVCGRPIIVYASQCTVVWCGGVWLSVA